MDDFTFSRHESAGWALLFGALATVGQGLLAGGLLAMEALVAGVGAVVASGTIAAPDGGRYALAVAVAVVLTLAGGPALAWVGFGASSRSWPAVVRGLLAAAIAAVTAACALLVVLGIDPTDFIGGP